MGSRVLVAPDKFKECLSASEVARAIAEGVARAVPTASIDLCPVADGGDGTVNALLEARGGRTFTAGVTGPLGSRVSALWALLPDGTAVIESASAAGLALVPPGARNPLSTTTFGIGELVRHALDAGARRVIMGLGGTATSDGGLGFAQALGVRFEGIDEPGTGAHLTKLRGIDRSGLDQRLQAVELLGACDVQNPLLGPSGAARTFAPQKGASPEQVEELERGLSEISRLAAARHLPADPGAPGTGAAGGLGFGLVAFCGAKLVGGAKLVLDALDFAGRARAHDLVLTAEGRLDRQTLSGKAVLEVARQAGASGVPTVVLTGAESVPAEELWEAGITAAFSICDGPLGLADAKARARELLSNRAAQVMKLWSAVPPRRN